MILIAAAVPLLMLAQWLAHRGSDWAVVCVLAMPPPMKVVLWTGLLFIAALVASGGALLCFIGGVRRWRWKPPVWACNACGYDRRGLAGLALCPECGSPPPTPRTPAPHP